MTSCNSVTVVAGFLVSLDEQGPDLRSLVAARMTALSVMFGV
jgi:hypothetical protein